MTEVITSNAARRGGGLQRWLPGLFHKRRAALLSLPVLAWAGAASAQLPLPASTQFDITGFLQEATLDPACASATCGGTLKVNGHTVTVPANTIVIYPANAVTWQELFSKAPAPWGLAGGFNGGKLAPTTGMAMADCAVAPTLTGCAAPPLTTYELHVVGNRVGDTYIAGLIDIAQQGLNSGAGYINFIDYTLGEMRVGGVIGDPTTGARVRINDPVGRYGRATTSPDVRFTVDPDNPTIMAGTGYPMCLPRTLPAALGVSTDTLCPEENRPFTGVDPVTGATLYVTSITTLNLTNPNFPKFLPGQFPDSTQQAPMEVGDYITYSGTLVKDAPAGGFGPGDGPTVGPTPVAGAAATYISAHTITNNVGIWTFQGSDPAYVMTEVTIIGTGGLTVLGAGEAVVRTRFEGMTTDVDPTGANQRGIHLYGIDLDSAGNTSDRDWGTIGVDPGPPNGAVKGRWRFRPPCLPFGSVVAKPDKQCVMNAAGTFLPVTREMRAVIEGLQSQNPANPAAIISANGLFYGQYHAPILEYIFPENVPGTPIVENNFNTIPFLACGGYTSSGIGIPPTAPVLAGTLSPWPSNVAPNPSACVGFVAPPTSAALAANPGSVISGTGATVTLTASAAGTNTAANPMTFTFTQAPTDVPQVTLTQTGNKATFTTPVVVVNTPLNFTVTATNSAGSTTASATVTVAVDQPVVNHVAPQTVASGVPVTLNITGTDPGGLPLTFTVTQTSGPSLTAGVVAPNVALAVTQGPNPPANAAKATFTYFVPAGATAQTFNFTIVAKNTANVSSASEFTSVTVNPIPDTISITSAEYRIGKQRTIITATSSAVNPPGAVLTLQPYACQGGVAACPPNGVYNPDPLAGGLGNVFINGGGVYTLTLVGAPQPLCNAGGAFATPCSALPLIVTSNFGGRVTTNLTKIRQ